MADKKISELTAITGANTAATDVFVVVDTSTGQTKKITREELNNAIEQDVLSSIDIDTINGDFSVNGNINLGDNNKAIFGAGNDLQIYHNGSHSFIEDTGTGSLYIKGGASVNLRSDGDEDMLVASANGAVTLYHDNSPKFATTSTGIDVTGTVTADGLTVDGTTSFTQKVVFDNNDELRWKDSGGTERTALYLDSSNNLNLGTSAGGNLRFINGSSYTERMRIDSSGNVGIGTTSPARKLDVVGVIGATGVSTPEFELVPTGSVGNADIRFDGSTLDIRSNSASASLLLSTSSTERMRIDNSGNAIFTKSGGAYLQLKDASAVRGSINVTTSDGLIFTTGSSFTERMRINSSGNVGIGTTSPDTALHVKSSNDTVAVIESNDATAKIQIKDNSSSNGANLAVTNEDFFVQVNGSERMRIDSSGNVGIGTTSPSTNLTVSSGASSAAVHSYTKLEIESSSHGALQLSGSTGAEQWIWFADDSSSTPVGGITYYHGGPYMAFRVEGSERMRIDSSGDVLMGNTVPNPASGFNNQSGFGFDTSAGKVEIASTSGLALSLGRNQASDGHLAEFRKQSNSVGDIQTHSGKLQIGQGNANLQLSNASDAIIPANGNGTLNDDALDIGLSNARFDDIYATNGTIQTSDRNEKQDIEALSEAEQRVAVAAKGLLRKFRWIDSVEEKGNDARIHFGIIAQDLQAAFEAEGLDAGRYAMFINSTWTDEETGEERSRMGVRYNQLLAFIIAAI